MKRRMGFVSNSSSSSFCLVGVGIGIESPEDEDVKRLLTPEALEKLKEIEYVDELYEAYGLECYYGEDCGTVVGVPIERMRNEQTLGEFKDYADAEIRKMIATERKSEIHYGSEYQG